MVLSAAFLFGACAGQKTIYVSPKGADGPACGAAEASACRTIGQALSLTAKGDTVLLAAGTYSEKGLAPSTGITLRGATGTAADVIIDGGNNGRIMEIFDVASGTHVRDLTIQRGLAISGACLVINTGATAVVLVTNVVVQDCAASEKAPAQPSDGKYANTVGCGGGIMVTGSANPTMKNIVVRNSAASLTGGGVFVDGTTTGTWDNLLMEGCHADAFGGGFRPEGKSQPLIRNSIFRKNYCGSGAAIDPGGATTAVVEDSLFEDNEAGAGGGGAMFTYGENKVTFRRCTFRRNKSGNGGGGVIVVALACQPTFIDCLFEDNVADPGNAGIGVLNCDSCGITMIGCTFRRSVGGYGGAFAIRGSPFVHLERCTFEGSTATSGDGGFLFGEVFGASDGVLAKVTIMDSVLTNSTTTIGKGGALFLRGNVMVSMVDSTIQDSSAAVVGGAVSLLDTGVFNALRSNLLRNSVKRGLGGAIHMDEKSVANLEGCTLRENFAQKGAAVYVGASSTLNSTRTVYDRNRAEQHGGAAYLNMKRPKADAAYFDACQFLGNEAALGGVVALDAGLAGTTEKSAVFRASSFAGNKASAGAVAYHFGGTEAPVALDARCSFDGNRALYGELAAGPPFRLAVDGPTYVAQPPGSPFTVQYVMTDFLEQPVTFTELPVVAQLSASEGLTINALLTVKVLEAGRVGFELSVEGLLDRNFTLAARAGDLPAAPISISTKPCAVGYSALTSATNYRCLPCPANSFNTNGDGVCKPCPAFATCPGRDSILVSRNYWVDPDSMPTGDPKLYRCAPGRCCPNGLCPALPADGQCTDDRHGAICGECKNGYAQWGGRCVSCERPVPGLIILPILAASLIVAVYWLTSLKTSSSGKIKSAVFFVQAVSLVMLDSEIGPASSFSWDQLVAQFIICPIMITPVQKVLLGYWIPCMTLAVLGVVALVVLVRQSIRERRPHLPYVDSRRLSNTFLQLLSFSYIAVATTSVRYVTCIDVGARSLVQSEPGVSCSSEEYKRNLPIVWTVMVVFVIGLPLYYVGILVYLYLRGDEYMYGDYARHTFGLLYTSYKPQYRFYEAFFMVRRIVLIAIDSAYAIRPTTRALGLAVACATFIVVQEATEPLIQFSDNVYERTFLFGLLLTSALELALATSYETPAFSIRILEYCMNCALFLAGAVAVGQVLLAVLQSRQQHRMARYIVKPLLAVQAFTKVMRSNSDAPDTGARHSAGGDHRHHGRASGETPSRVHPHPHDHSSPAPPSFEADPEAPNVLIPKLRTGTGSTAEEGAARRRGGKNRRWSVASTESMTRENFSWGSDLEDLVVKRNASPGGAGDAPRPAIGELPALRPPRPASGGAKRPAAAAEGAPKRNSVSAAGGERPAGLSSIASGIDHADLPTVPPARPAKSTPAPAPAAPAKAPQPTKAAAPTPKPPPAPGAPLADAVIILAADRERDGLDGESSADRSPPQSVALLPHRARPRLEPSFVPPAQQALDDDEGGGAEAAQKPGPRPASAERDPPPAPAPPAPAAEVVQVHPLSQTDAEAAAFPEDHAFLVIPLLHQLHTPRAAVSRGPPAGAPTSTNFWTF